MVEIVNKENNPKKAAEKLNQKDLYKINILDQKNLMDKEDNKKKKEKE